MATDSPASLTRGPLSPCAPSTTNTSPSAAGTNCASARARRRACPGVSISCTGRDSGVGCCKIKGYRVSTPFDGFEPMARDLCSPRLSAPQPSPAVPPSRQSLPSAA